MAGQSKARRAPTPSPPNKKKTKRPPARLGRTLRSLAAVAALLVLLPVAQVGCARFIDPPVSTMMIQRELQARLDGRDPPGIHTQWMPLSEVPEDFLRFVLVSEDARFFNHNGMDWVEINAAWRDHTERGRPLRGASTVTMQCARSLFLWQGRSVARKALEIPYALLMEAMLDKNRILELYVNHIEMGDGVYGLAAAAQSHFHRPPADLSRAELATLAAMLPAPREWNPANPDETLAARRDRVLQRAAAFQLPGQATE